MMRSTLILAVVLATGCESHRPLSGHIAEPFEVRGVDSTDGVDREEAQRLASRYFEEFHGSCGGVTFSQETSEGWRFKTDVGFAATPGKDIVVLKSGTKLSQEGSPDVVYVNGAWSYRGRNFFGDESRG